MSRKVKFLYSLNEKYTLFSLIGYLKTTHSFKHHKEATTFLAKFAKDVRNLKIALSYLLNPFKDRTSELINIITNDIAGDGVADLMKLLETTESGLESNYVTDVVSGENPITDPLKNVGSSLSSQHKKGCTRQQAELTLMK